MYAKQIRFALIVAVLISFSAQAVDGNHQIIPGDSLSNPPIELLKSRPSLPTNAAEWWQGAWNEDTNGWRTQLEINRSWLTVEVGSKLRDSDGCFETPNGKFAKFELSDSSGNVLQPKKDAGTNLLRIISLSYPTNLPAWATPSAGSLVADFPLTTSTNVFPRYSPNGLIACMVGFYRQGPPAIINQLDLNSFFSITNEGDYILTVCPILYSRHIARVTFTREQLKEHLKEGLSMGYWEKDGIIYAYTNIDNPIVYRRDMPCVTAKVHLVPSKN